VNFVLFCHSIVSDWNHGNAHFLRGVVRELKRSGHHVDVWEPADGWSRKNLLEENGDSALGRFQQTFPFISPSLYHQLNSSHLDMVLDDADVVLVHEWNDPEVIAAIGRHKQRCGRYLLFFHDTHHRSVTAAEEMARFDLSSYDGVLAFGQIISEFYSQRNWASRVWTWHEAADTALFVPERKSQSPDDLVWIGNWGDDERSAELSEFLFEPARNLGLRTSVYGVRYPETALKEISASGAQFCGWVPNHLVPQVFSDFACTVHIPRRPYVQALPGIPTIRVFEAMACGIPLVCAPWEDAEGLFTPGEDYLVARNGKEMEKALRDILNDRDLADQLSQRSVKTILQRHTCKHRVDELLNICNELGRKTDPGNSSFSPII
jgi:spore maturation protein CgeB